MTLVDGSGFLLFFRQLSQLYQGLGPVDPPPSYPPNAIKFAEPLRPPSQVYRCYDPSAPPPWERPERKAMEFVAFRLTAAQLTEIHKSVTKGMKHLRIARADMVVGLLARCLSEVEPESKPIDTISYVINVRAFVAPPAHDLTNSVIASRDGYTPDQHDGQCYRLALRGNTITNRGRSSRRCFGLCHGNT